MGQTPCCCKSNELPSINIKDVCHDISCKSRCLSSCCIKNEHKKHHHHKHKHEEPKVELYG